MHLSKAQIINIALISPSLLKHLISFIKSSTSIHPKRTNLYANVPAHLTLAVKSPLHISAYLVQKPLWTLL